MELSASTWRKVFLFDPWGSELGAYYESDTSVRWSRNVNFGGRVGGLLRRDEPEVPARQFCGTTVYVTDGTGVVLQDQRWCPWGQQWDHAGSVRAVHFASLQQIGNTLDLPEFLYHRK